MLLGKKIKELRDEYEALQRQLAALLEIDTPMFSKIERGDRRAKRTQVAQLVEYFNIDKNAKWKKENKAWLEWSRNIALSLVKYMETNGLNRNGLAERLDVSPQYVSKILSGKVNFSFKSIAELEQKLGIKLLDVLELA